MIRCTWVLSDTDYRYYDDIAFGTKQCISCCQCPVPEAILLPTTMINYAYKLLKIKTLQLM